MWREVNMIDLLPGKIPMNFNKSPKTEGDSVIINRKEMFFFLFGSKEGNKIDKQSNGEGDRHHSNAYPVIIQYITFINIPKAYTEEDRSNNPQ